MPARVNPGFACHKLLVSLARLVNTWVAALILANFS
jgi:hypothetical protein